LIYFSPTGTTRRVLEAIASSLEPSTLARIDLTPPDALPDGVTVSEGIALIGVPVYAGRVPAIAVERLRRVRGDRIPVVLVVVYGNRAYDDALLELGDMVAGAGFLPVAGGAFIGEHSFSTEALPIAPGRPDADDLRRAGDFGRSVRLKLQSLAGIEAPAPPYLPGHYPYRDRWTPSGDTPISDESCSLCGACVSVCPTAALEVGDAAHTDAGACILCCACVRACPVGARRVESERIGGILRWLHEDYAAHREPEVYL